MLTEYLRCLQPAHVELNVYCSGLCGMLIQLTIRVSLALLLRNIKVFAGYFVCQAGIDDLKRLLQATRSQFFLTPTQEEFSTTCACSVLEPLPRPLKFLNQLSAG